MLDERQQLEIQYLQLQEEKRLLDAERRRFEAQRAAQAFEDHKKQNAIEKLNIYAKCDASVRRSALKANIQDRIEGGMVDESLEDLSPRDIARILRARRIADERRARSLREQANDEHIGDSDTTKTNEPSPVETETKNANREGEGKEEGKETVSEEDSFDEDDDSSQEEESEYEIDEETDVESYEDIYMFEPDIGNSRRVFLSRAGEEEGTSEEDLEVTDEEGKPTGISWFQDYLNLLGRARAFQEGLMCSRSCGRALQQIEEMKTDVEFAYGEEQKEYEVVFREPGDELLNMCSTSYILNEALTWNKLLITEDDLDMILPISFDDGSSCSSSSSMSDYE